MYKYKNLKITSYFIISFFLMDSLLNLFIINGLEKYYGLNDFSNLALIGHSQLALGLDKIYLEKKMKMNISKYTRAGTSVTDRYFMTKQLVTRNKNIKTIIYGVDPWTFTKKGLSKNSYKLFYPFMDDIDISNYIKKNTSFFDFYLKKYIKSTRLNEIIFFSSLRGHLRKWNNLKYGKLNIEILKKELDQGKYRKIENFELLVADLKKTIRFLKEEKIQIILLNMPVVDLLLKTQEDEYNFTINIYKDLARLNNNVEYLEFENYFYNDYEMFFDSVHLNPYGQKILTEKLFNKVNKLQGYLF